MGVHVYRCLLCPGHAAYCQPNPYFFQQSRIGYGQKIVNKGLAVYIHHYSKTDSMPGVGNSSYRPTDNNRHV